MDDINRYYGLPCLGQSWREMSNEVTKCQIGEVLSDGHPRWIEYPDKGTYELNWKSINYEGKAWLTFICANIIPTTSFSRINHERCALAYYIITGKPIDIGSIMSDQLWLSMRDNTKDIFFPSLVTGLCKRKRVPKLSNDIELNIRKPIADFTASLFKEATHDEPQAALPARDEPEASSSHADRRFRNKMEREMIITRNRLTTGEHKVNTVEALQWWSSKMLQAIVQHLGCGTPDCIEPAPLPAPILEPVPELSDEDERERARAEHPDHIDSD
ncbi:PREDICTED: uncharacterized protein LOC105959851 [Erythranthe guttata]|uniref:uncharacterized protein LOC105959851 n=1 Tax=Erythranthe guttata TaxID=4155 RepID=UPI00064DB503|nr:PREDICTED: uncharacterized protein LOC105959851 [Erythranthe guttata]|eukprot:XP_012839470.1 PREDICTED: uncharacterized protein LOC105959851 [Erythranthe guttata]